MNPLLPNLRLQCAMNLSAQPNAKYGERQQAILGGQAYLRAEQQIKRWPVLTPSATCVRQHRWCLEPTG
ncbi:hypothetical protein [Verminephrobacter eiseniae]|uniref:hypothetical protein n=1 Tax=Verminephrobacter eiseniae TaxID=364317 RepID=UPI0012EE73C9|nr:hypothetical protein [Verminephrobacter eiseniae]